jgi:hypothetical protein
LTGKTQHAARDEQPAKLVRANDDGRTRTLVRVSSIAAAQRTRRGATSAGGSASSGTRPAGLFTDQELRQIEEQHPEGLTAVQIVDLFATRQLRFSEATFRKYVQLGLVPRSRRVGRKGKHRGSLGVYPAKAIRRINAVRRLMDEGRTIEEIQSELGRFADVIETLEEGLSDLFHRFAAEVDGPRFDSKTKKNLRREVDDARRSADELIRRLDDLSQRVSRPRDDSFGGTGAAGSAEELL